MPIYEYECIQCGKIEEAIQKFSDKPLKKCRHCSGKLHRLISQSTFHLKGSGWYVTDYANRSSAAKSAKHESKATPKPKSESKQANKGSTTPKAD
jgi:putative FmdB family regulatory protein